MKRHKSVRRRRGAKNTAMMMVLVALWCWFAANEQDNNYIVFGLFSLMVGMNLWEYVFGIAMSDKKDLFILRNLRRAMQWQRIAERGIKNLTRAHELREQAITQIAHLQMANQAMGQLLAYGSAEQLEAARPTIKRQLERMSRIPS